ncbi:MAG TPA: hypothetical protein EYG73_11745 [Arcobacter sp.]|nr:hypothetical protein [Arcobacter sp.]
MKILLIILFVTQILFSSVGIVSAFKGSAHVLRDGEKLEIKTGFKLEEKDILLTQKQTKLQLIFKDKTIITIGQNSKFEIEAYFYDEKKKPKVKARFGFAKGIFRTVSGKIGKINPDKFKIKANSATIGIRGTKFDVIVTSKNTQIGVLQGIVYHEHNNKIVDINPGEILTFTIKTNIIKVKEGTLKENIKVQKKIKKEAKKTIQKDSKKVIKEVELKKSEITTTKESTVLPKTTIKTVIESLEVVSTPTSTELLSDIKVPTIESIIDNFDEIFISYDDVIDNSPSNATQEETVTTTTNTSSETLTSDLSVDVDINTLKTDELAQYFQYSYWLEENWMDIQKYLAENLTPEDIIQGYIDGGNTASYIGDVSAKVNTAADILKGNINLEINFGTQNISGSIYNIGDYGVNFNGSDSSPSDKTFTSAGFALNSGFDGKSQTVSSASIEGKFYGSTGSIVGGKFNYTLIDGNQNINIINGVYGSKLTTK